ncbi:MAG: hypothetical protein H6741_22280 [Alphaproteobacteria bacterium]|nr:hypothetical protein [Alphaproteobacteria bacterium]
MINLVGKKLLVVSATPHRAASLREVLTHAGLEVTVTLTPSEALLALEQLPQDILLIDGRFGEPFPDAFPRVRLQHRGQPIRDVLLIDPPRGPALTHWQRVLSSHGIEPRTLPESNPYQVIEGLLEALKPAPAVKAGGSRPLHPANMPPQPEALHFLLGVWARRHSGLLEMPLMGLRAQLVGGEPASAEDLPVLVQAMYVGGATFSPTRTHAQPGEPVLGAHLWEAGQRLADPESVLSRMSSLLVERSAGRRAVDLPLPEPLKAMLAVRRGRASLLGLCAAAGVAPSAIAEPLSALIRMGLFSLRQAPGVAAREEPPSLLPAMEPPPPSASRDTSSVEPAFRTHRFNEPAQPPSPPPAPPPAPRAPERPPPRRAASVETPPRPAPPRRDPPSVEPPARPAPRREPPSVEPSRERSREPSRDHSRERSREPSRDHSREHSVQRPQASERRPLQERLREKPARSAAPRAQARRASPEATAALLKRLSREWELIELADDWTTLGIPADSSSELVARAVDRLQRRYGALSQGEQTDPEVQELAQRILERVRAAGAAVSKGQHRAPGQSQPEAAFREGVRALERGSFSHAARWFQSARQSDPRNAIYNGYLGWAVYNDPSLPKERRRKKGFELLQLAEVTAEPVPELQYFLAKVEAEEGEVSRARARLKRLIRTKPEYTAARRALDALPSEPPTE